MPVSEYVTWLKYWNQIEPPIDPDKAGDGGEGQEIEPDSEDEAGEENEKPKTVRKHLTWSTSPANR